MTFKISSPAIVIAIILGSIFSSCKKNDENGPHITTKEKFLAGSNSKTWKITGLEGQPNEGFASTLTIDFYNNKISAGSFEIPNTYNIPMPQECYKDNLYILSQDKTYQITEGASKCNASDPEVVNVGTWKFNSDETLLTFTASNGTVLEYKVLEITDKILKGETQGEYNYQGAPIKYKATTTFTAK